MKSCSRQGRQFNRRRSGLSLIEVTIALSIASLVISTALLAARAGVGAFGNTMRNSHTETRLHRAIERVTSEMIGVIGSELVPNPTTEWGAPDWGPPGLVFRSAIGLVGTTPQPGVANRLLLEIDPLEVDDGLDNDGDGLVDEGQLVLVRDVGGAEQRVVLCGGVAELFEGEIANGADDNGNGVKDEAGFNVRRVGDVLSIRLCLQKASEQGIVERSLTTSIRLRN